jgi:hypothetical protein
LGEGYKFDFYITGRNGLPYVSFSSRSMGFNKAAVRLLGFPKYVEIGIDVEKRTMGIRAKRIKTRNTFRFCFERAINADKMLRVNCKKLVFMLRRFCNTKEDVLSVKYSAVWDNELKMLLVSLKEDNIKQVMYRNIKD